MSIFQQSEARGLARFPSLKIVHLFSKMGINVAKSSNYIKKRFKQKLIKIIKFPTRNSVNAYLFLSQEWSKGAPNIYYFWNTMH